MTPSQKPHPQGEVAGVVVGTDGSPTATQAVRRAAELARAEGAPLHLVTAYSTKQGWEQRREIEAMPEEDRWRASPGEVAETMLRQTATDIVGKGVAVSCHARPGDPADVLVEVAGETGARLLVVGNRGMRGTGRMVVPSVPNRVSHRAPCDVLIVDTTAA
jgi:nucleotide-binding universal stress UspA family protein